MRIVSALVCVGMLLVGFDAHASDWLTVARGRTKSREEQSRVRLQTDGKHYRLVSRFEGGMIQLGPNREYAKPQRTKIRFRQVQPGIFLPKGTDVKDSPIWLLTFGTNGMPALTRFIAPDYAGAGYQPVSGDLARRVLAAPVLKHSKGEFESRWELRALDGQLYHVISGGTPPEDPVVVPYKVHDLWLQPLRMARTQH